MGFFWPEAPLAMETPEKYPIDRAALQLRIIRLVFMPD